MLCHVCSCAFPGSFRPDKRHFQVIFGQTKDDFQVGGNHLLPIGADIKPGEAVDADVDKDIDENHRVDVAEVEEDKDYEAENPDDEQGGDPDEGGVDEVAVGGADADDEEGAGGERDG